MLEITVETFKMQVVGLKAKQTRAVALQGGSHKSSSSSSSNCRVMTLEEVPWSVETSVLEVTIQTLEMQLSALVVPFK